MADVVTTPGGADLRNLGEDPSGAGLWSGWFPGNVARKSDGVTPEGVAVTITFPEETREMDSIPTMRRPVECVSDRKQPSEIPYSHIPDSNRQEGLHHAVLCKAM